MSIFNLMPKCNSRTCLIWPLIYQLGIFCLSSIPDQGQENTALNPLVWMSPNVQNSLHIPLYGGLALTWFFALRHWFIKPWHFYLLSLLLTVGYGALDEWHQTFVPGRYGSFTDASFDLIGALFGLLIAHLIAAKHSN